MTRPRALFLVGLVSGYALIVAAIIAAAAIPVAIAWWLL